MNPYADHMRQIAKLYSKSAPEKWRRIMRGMCGDETCREDYEQWKKEHEQNKSCRPSSDA